MTTPDHPSSFWDQRFSESGYAYGTEPNDFLRQVASQIPAGPVLCLAAGEGRNAVFLASLGHDVLAVDFSPIALAKTQTLAREKGVTVRTQQADLSDFPISQNTWAGIFSCWMHLAPPVRAKLHQQIAAGLLPGGVYIAEAYAPEQIHRNTGGPSNPDLLISAADFQNELPNLQFKNLQELIRPISEGRYHNGLSSVIQVLAVRPQE